MYVYLDENPRAALGGTLIPAYEPCIVMFTAQKKHQPGWLASQPDMLAEDWVIVRPKGRRR